MVHEDRIARTYGGRTASGRAPKGLLLLSCSLFFILLGADIASGKSLVFLHYWSGPMAGGVEEMARAFNQTQDGLTLEPRGFEHESFKVGIKVMLGAGRPPDLFSYWAGSRVRDLVDRDWIEAVDDVWKDNGLESRFTSVVADACRYDGRYYAVPLTQHYVAFFYDKAVFDSLGLRPPRSWPEFLDVCEQLKAAGTIPLALGSRDRWPAQFWFDYLLLRTAGPEYRRELMEGRASYHDPEVKRAFLLWKELLDKGYFLPQPEVWDWSEAAKHVRNGRAAMTLMGGWIIGLFDGQLGWKQGEDYDFFSFPLVEEGVPQVSVGPIDVAVAAKGGAVADAKKALLFLTEVAPQKAMSLGSGALAPNIEVSSEFYSPLQRRMAEIVQEAPVWAFAYDLAVPPSVAEEGLDAFAKFLKDPGELDHVLAGLQERAVLAKQAAGR